MPPILSPEAEARIELDRQGKDFYSQEDELNFIRIFLSEEFTKKEFLNLCADSSEFESVCSQLTLRTRKAEIVRLIAEYAYQKNLRDVLLKGIHDFLFLGHDAL